MLQAITRLAVAAPRRILAVTLLLMVGAGIFGASVVESLPAGGFRDPTSESWHASEILVDKFEHGDMQLIFEVSSDEGARSERASAVGGQLAAELSGHSFVTGLQSPWTSPPQVADKLISTDGRTGLIVAGITGGEHGAQLNAKSLLPLAYDRDGVTVTPGGEALAYVQVTEQTRRDLLTMEAIALPLSFVVLVWVFGGLLAAAVPLAVGGFAILGSLAVLRVTSAFTDVSVFALNLIIAMGLALAIDYTLLIVSRYRDELADGTPCDQALTRTMATAGRTVLFSALTVALSMSTMILFPMYFLKSFAYAGVAVVALAATAAVVVTPAILALLGDRLNALDVRQVIRRRLSRVKGRHHDIDGQFWYRWTKGVLRHPVSIGAAVVAVLLLLGAPFLGVKWGFPDDRVLPESASARQVADDVRSGFDANSLTNVSVVLPDAAGLTLPELDRYGAELSRIPDVTSVAAPGGTFVEGLRVGAPNDPTGVASDSAYLTVATRAPLFSDASETQLARLHAVAGPGGREVLMTGRAQINRDSADAVASRLPMVLGVIAAISFVLLFLLTGSVVLPLKALVLNLLSLTASFGALVWIFQDGHLGAFGTTPTGTLVATVPILLFCLAFGLSMDYEVFLLARIREFWLASSRGRADNDEAVARGVARTGRVVTAAALLMAVSFSALMAAEISFMKMFGLGLTLAVLIDATLVRLLLMPAFMHLLGTWNWWAPAPLRRLHRHVGVRESAEPAPVPAVP